LRKHRGDYHATCGVIFINSAPTCHRCIWANHNWRIFYTQWSFANFYIIDPPFEIFFTLFIKKEFSMIIPAVFAQLFVFCNVKSFVEYIVCRKSLNCDLLRCIYDRLGRSLWK
jgi:hypothetical protein